MSRHWKISWNAIHDWKKEKNQYLDTWGIESGKKIQHWSGKHLSKAGREVLIKSMAQAIPSYCMSAFLLPPSTLQDEIQKIMNSFWWGSNINSSKDIRWFSCKRLTIRKENEGMGFQHLFTFNLAILGKQGWKLASDQDAVVSQVFKAKYYHNGEFLGSSLGHNPSYTWHIVFTLHKL